MKLSSCLNPCKAVFYGTLVNFRHGFDLSYCKTPSMIMKQNVVDSGYSSNQSSLVSNAIPSMVSSLAALDLTEVMQEANFLAEAMPFCSVASFGFRGTCWSSSNCDTVCRAEGFLMGNCKGVLRKCKCFKDCGVGGGFSSGGALGGGGMGGAGGMSGMGGAGGMGGMGGDPSMGGMGGAGDMGGMGGDPSMGMM